MTEKTACFKEWLHRIGVDRAALYGVLTRIWGIAAAPVTVLLIAGKFTPQIQGYYYTFWNLLALQIFVELGLGTVIIQFASHEWSRLSLDANGFIVGDDDALSRLISMARVAIRWYFVAGIVLMLGLSVGGVVFFSTSHASALNIKWLFPWLTLCLLTGIITFGVPIWSLLEGCNQVSNVYRFRLWQGMLGSLAAWASMLAGLNLWTPAVSSVACIFISVIFLKRKYWNFIKTLFFSLPGKELIIWKKDILPMQWRIAISWASGYFVFSFFTPVLFRYHGPVLAGQFGLTWNLIMVIGSISGALLAPKVPQFGILIAQRKYPELDALFWKIVKMITLVSMIIGLMVWLVIYFLKLLSIPLASRLLSPLSAGIFILAQIIVTFTIPFSAYIRAHKEEPLMFISLSAGILVGLSTLILGKYYADIGMAIGYLIINITLVSFILLIWKRYRDSHEICLSN
ncbi:MAG: hypothetical protein WC081_02640 [Candidatus Ratteibacteria bacterium]